MRSFFSNLNPFVRGMLVLVAIAVVVVVLQLQATLYALLIVARIAFLLAIAFFIYLLWRDRRQEISEWPMRARVVFYGAAVLAVADLAVNWWRGAGGWDTAAFVAVLALCGFAMYRVWKDMHTFV